MVTVTLSSEHAACCARAASCSAIQRCPYITYCYHLPALTRVYVPSLSLSLLPRVSTGCSEITVLVCSESTYPPILIYFHSLVGFFFLKSITQLLERGVGPYRRSSVRQPSPHLERVVSERSMTRRCPQLDSCVQPGAGGEASTCLSTVNFGWDAKLKRSSFLQMAESRKRTGKIPVSRLSPQIPRLTDTFYG